MSNSRVTHRYWTTIADSLFSIFLSDELYEKSSPELRRRIAGDWSVIDQNFDDILYCVAFLSSLFVVATLWAEVIPVHLLTWFAIYTTLIALSVGIRHLCESCDQTENHPRKTRAVERFKVCRLIVVAAHGVAWGSTALLFIDGTSHHAQYSIFIALSVLNGVGVVLAAGGIALYLAFFLPSMLPLQLMLLLYPFSGSGFATLLLPFYLVVLFCVARTVHHVISRVLQYRYNDFNLAEECKSKLATLEQRDEAKTRFLSVVSHDLRQPVHAIGLLADELHVYVTNTQGQELLVGINSAIDSLRQSLDSLLNLTKLEAEVIRPNIVRFPLQRVFDRLDDEFAALARKRQVLLKFIPTRLEAFSDPNMLHSIVSNFVSNALDYNPHGRVTIGCKRHAEDINIVVFDNGPGIPSNRVDEIFRPFHRLATTRNTSDSIAHAGLGLAIAERTARVLGHSISVRSQVSKGSSFQVTVRRAVRPDTSSNGRLATVEQDCHGVAVDGLKDCVIAYLEDETLVREQTAALFRRWGCIVRESASVQEFLQANCSPNTPPDIIVTDHRIGSVDHVNGIAAIEQARTRCSKQIPAVVVSGDTTGDAAVDAQRLGLRIVHKPVKPAHLRTIIAGLRRSVPD